MFSLEKGSMNLIDLHFSVQQTVLIQHILEIVEGQRED